MRGGNSGGQYAARDPMIYPDFYAPSGFDMMGILVGVSSFLFLFVNTITYIGIPFPKHTPLR